MSQPLLPKLRRRSTLWRRLAENAVRLALFYCLFCFVYYLRQQAHLFPGQGTQGQPYAMLPPSSNYQLVEFTTAAHNERITAIFGQALDERGNVRSDAASRPTILYFNGNAATIASFLDVFQRLRGLGCNVLIPDYPGYGMSDGYASEHNFYACADAAYDYLCHHTDVDRTQIISAGWSLGSAVAIDLATRRPVRGLIVLSAFSSWPAIASDHTYWRPASVWLQAGFDNQSKIAHVTCPVLIAHGRHDELIPFSMSEQLARARGLPPPLAINSGHNVFRSDELFNALGRFVVAAVHATNPAPTISMRAY
jgi:pimeloyl-ACP methyl ester carboxylesterase